MQQGSATIFSHSNDPPQTLKKRQRKLGQNSPDPPTNGNSEEQLLNDPLSRKKIRYTVLEYLNKYLPKEDERLKFDPNMLEESYKEGLKEGFRENLKVKGRDPVEEARKEYIKQEEQDKYKFNELFQRRKLVLFRASAIFPFDFFPDEIIIELNKINIICREFFFSENRHCIPIKNIQDVIVECAPFFATIKIISVPFVENSISVKYLLHHDAKKAQRIIDGLIIAIKEDIDFSHLQHIDLVKKLEELGKIRTMDA